MTPGEFIEVFDTIAEAPGGIERLRELVLQLAVRGKLVPQDEGEEPAPVLLGRISADNKLKPEKRLSPVNEADVPWRLPSSWIWVRLRQIVNFTMGKTPPTRDISYWSDESGHPWVSIADMSHFGIVSETKRRVTTKATSEVFGCPPVSSGTILMSFKLTIGKIARLGVDAYHNEAIIALYPVIDEMDAYLFQLMPLFSYGGSSKDAIKGKTLNSNSLSNLLVALPPLAEQHRIVAKVDELMGLIDRLEATRHSRETIRTASRDSALAVFRNAATPEEVGTAWTRIDERMDDLFTASADLTPLLETVLQLAVQGQLVPQELTDEPASVLLDRIAKTLPPRKELRASSQSLGLGA